ncbi:ficolin-2-like [Amphiura filiformis]|uniref:ficolin-2-like n=1 Tax=Amphiura filiformis TaxID=82378 RepID=UPI003B21B78F
MDDKRIEDEQITASSVFSSTWNTDPQNARLNRQETDELDIGAWAAATNDVNQWIQVDLRAAMWVSGVMTQGRNSHTFFQMVTRFKVVYNTYGSEWKHFKTADNQEELVFDGNTDQDTVVTNLFPSSVRATTIRIIPIEWIEHISMRFDLIGCEAPQDCYEILNSYGRNTSGIYWIYPIINGTSTPAHMQVWCDMETDGGGWTEFQRRVDSSEDFYRYWADYKTGFGDLLVAYWLGNDNIYALVNNGKTYELRLDLNDGSEWKYDLYASFVITDEAGDYTLTLGDNIGGEAGNSFAFHKSQKFTTRDADNDWWNNGNCAGTCKGGWWYKACIGANLNGMYRNGVYSAASREGIEYESWKGSKYSLAVTEMKVRPVP